MKTMSDILAIDDEAVVLEGLQRICASEGLSVDTASSAREGMQRLDSGSYRLVICDIMLGDLDGFAFLAALRLRPSHPPVIMTTGYSTVENAVRSLSCGAVDYVAKPFTADELLAAVFRCLHLGGPAASETQAATDMPPDADHFHCLGEVSWAKTEPLGTVLIGMNDRFARTMKGIQSVTLLPKGTVLVQGTDCATVVSSDGLPHGLLSPLSGRILEVHAEAAAQPAAIEGDAYRAGWLYRIVPSNLEHGLSYLTLLSATLGSRNPSGNGEVS